MTQAGPNPTPRWNPPAATEALRLILVRHGSTEATAGRKYSGRGDVPLSAQGHEQAEAAATRVMAIVGGTPVTELVSSPLTRCVATAEAIAKALASGPTSGAASGPAQVPYRIEPDLVECDFGSWEGLGFAEVMRDYPDNFQAWLGSLDVAPEGGESFREVGARAARVVEALRARHQTGVVIAVTHVSPIKMILRDALLAAEGFLHRCYLSPAGISVVDFYPDGGVAVRAVNETGHLSG